MSDKKKRITFSLKEIFPKLDINKSLQFGKHEGRSIKSIYTGRESLNEDERTAIMLQFIDLKMLGTYPNGKIIDITSPTLISTLHGWVGENEMSEGQKILLQCNGYPDYITWLIKNTDYEISKSDLIYLETLDVLTVKSITLHSLLKVSEEKYSCHFDIQYTRRKHKFNENLFSKLRYDK